MKQTLGKTLSKTLRNNEKRYDKMPYRRCGESGLKLPAVSLGLWHNFGDNADYNNMCQMCFTAFDNGITHFDLANNYGPEPGSAETNFGKIIREHLSSYRDEMIISTKAGYYMWPGPYGDFGSKKYLTASLDQMLMYGKEASNRKQEIDRQHYTIPNQRPKDKHCGKI